MKADYEREVIFIETKNRDVFCLKNPDVFEDMGETIHIRTKNATYNFAKSELIYISVERKVGYDFTKQEEKGGVTCES